LHSSGQKIGDKGSVGACPDDGYFLKDRRPQGAMLKKDYPSHLQIDHYHLHFLFVGNAQMP
jgi:hypothetical protein